MSKLSAFFARAVQAQAAVAGGMLAVSRPKTGESWNITGVLTSRDGSMTAEAGGVIVSITAHALIPKNELYSPKTGDRLTSGGQLYMLVSVISSPDDGAWSCDLVSVQK